MKDLFYASPADSVDISIYSVPYKLTEDKGKEDGVLKDIPTYAKQDVQVVSDNKWHRYNRSKK